ncbi:uncharacterized protein TERG_11581 [Trichophyton rubrum CBS 118892]|uniref:Uncharacterized protein n=1 Tax=Trichophyton rubrum (strain ATCC MYA-4607 / CBS 118892) TaxID=559305 RepID=A0A080WPY6_TRIRC|nr:uncharacterized protein TERG_11581 [Trichophyton rubrum CBS 118892]KFL60263.1 hypothetical protein TERG_11581 [Trichophyton rubrum CBS 118892]
MVLPKFFKSPKPVDKKKHKASPSASSIADQTADAPSPSTTTSLPRRKTDTAERPQSTSLDQPPAYRRETPELSDPFGPLPPPPQSSSAQSSPTKGPHRRLSTRPHPSSTPSSPTSSPRAASASASRSRPAPRPSTTAPAAAGPAAGAASARSRRELSSSTTPNTAAATAAAAAASPGLKSKLSKKASSGGRFALDPNSHPLNLPPDELRRLSANMAAAAAAAERDDTLRSSMDIDRDGPSSPSGPSPFSAAGTTPLKPEVNGTGNHPQDTEGVRLPLLTLLHLLRQLIRRHTACGNKFSSR